MNARKNLRNRIHGWLPNNPWVGNAGVQATAKNPDWQEIKMETAKPRGGWRLSWRMAGYSAVWAFIGFLNIVGPGRSLFSVSWVFTTTWVVVGVAVGVVCGLELTRRLANTLAKNYDGSTTLRLTMIALGVGILVIAALNALVYISVPTSVGSALFTAVCACAPAVLFTRAAATWVWELKHGAKVYEDRNGSYAVSKHKGKTHFSGPSNQAVDSEAGQK